MPPQHKRRSTAADPSRSVKKVKLAVPRSQPHASTSAIPAVPPTTAPPAPSTSRLRRINHHRIAPLKPPNDQAISNRPSASALNNPTREIKGRDVIFVTRKTGLGMYLKRCKALLVDEGLNHITLHALCASIPHCLLLLHALLDILPYPKQYVNYEIRTSTVECTDEVFGKTGVEDETMEVFEEEEGEMRTRLKSSLEIIVRIGKSARSPGTIDPSRSGKAKSSRKARPGKAARAARRRANEGEDEQPLKEGEERDHDEETMLVVTSASGVNISGVGQREKSQAAVAGRNKVIPVVVDLSIDEEDMMNG